MLAISIGQFSTSGTKAVNQDSLGACLPDGVKLALKGAVAAIADGVSSSDVSDIASETAVKSFLQDYFCTSDAWSVKHAGTQVLSATNAWLYAQSKQRLQGENPERGYVCTFSALVVKHRQAHVFHVGDSRVYRIRASKLEQLTRDHRTTDSAQRSYLSNALGIAPVLQCDSHTVPVEKGDTFLLATDGVYEFVSDSDVCELLDAYAQDLDTAASELVARALANGSDDNLTAQFMRVDSVPDTKLRFSDEAEELPLPPVLEAGQSFDNFTILRTLYSSARSHVYLAHHIDDDTTVVLKAPSVEMGAHPGFLDQMLREEWVARRVSSQYVVKAPQVSTPRHFLYTVSEYIEGQTLAQWIKDNPEPGLETIRDIIEQVARGLIALHRSEILHQDIRPENIMITPQGLVKLIDLGAAYVAGIAEMGEHNEDVPGTAMYAAPEYFLGAGGTVQSEQFSLAVMTYYMLSGRFPYGSEVAKCRTQVAQHKLVYFSVLDPHKAIPFWLDDTLRKALSPNPTKRYQALSEFIYDLRHPNPKYVNRQRPPLIERHPVRFWQSVSLALFLIVLGLLFTR